MNQSESEADPPREGRGTRANETHAKHGHDRDARVIVIGGEIAIALNVRADAFHVGGGCAVAAVELHAEHIGGRRAV